MDQLAATLLTQDHVDADRGFNLDGKLADQGSGHLADKGAGQRVAVIVEETEQVKGDIGHGSFADLVEGGGWMR